MLRKLSWSLALISILMGCQGWRNNTSIVEDTGVANLSPVPPYLDFILPGPGESYNLAAYQELPSTSGWITRVPGICFTIHPTSLLEPGDFPTTEEWLARVSLVVDGQPSTSYDSAFQTDSLGAEFFDADGQLIMREPDGSPFRLCFEAPLDIGLHEATLIVEKASGEEVRYTWSFAILE